TSSTIASPASLSAASRSIADSAAFSTASSCSASDAAASAIASSAASVAASCISSLIPVAPPSLGRAAYRGPRDGANRRSEVEATDTGAGPSRGGSVIEQIEAPAGVVAFAATGTIEAEDYAGVLRPAVEQAMAGDAK